MTSLAVLLKESWSHVEDRAGDLANYFYAKIFLTDPNLRDLFPIDMSLQRSRLLGALVHSVQMVDDPDRWSEYLRALGRDHRKFHVSPEHYGVVGMALIEAIRAYSGPYWCIEYDQAWRDAYDIMATKMLQGAESDDNPPYWHAEVLAHERRGRDVAVFTCRPLQPFTYHAGQYVSLECQHQPRLWRTYSIANAPRSDGTMEFHVRATGTGWVSAALVRKLHAGDMIRLGPAMGSMTIDRNSTRDIVAVAGGTGLAPIKALMDDMTRYNRSRWMHVFFGAKDRDDLYDLGALSRLAGRYPWLSVIPATSDDPTYWGERGTINEVVERFGPWSDHDFYVCGSPPMVKATLGTLAGLGVPHGRVRYDAVAALPEAPGGV